MISSLSTKYKKELGRWGEGALDSWLAQTGWQVEAFNLKIKHGEIDRIYTKHDSTQIQLCLAEIKTIIFFTPKDFETFFSEVGFKRLLKQRQLQNLYKLGEHLNAQLQSAQKQFKIYIRFFVVAKCVWPHKVTTTRRAGNGSIKLCFRNEHYDIFSVEPEFTPYLGRKSLLQIHGR